MPIANTYVNGKLVSGDAIAIAAARRTGTLGTSFTGGAAEFGLGDIVKGARKLGGAVVKGARKVGEVVNVLDNIIPGGGGNGGSQLVPGVQCDPPWKMRNGRCQPPIAIPTFGGGRETDVIPFESSGGGATMMNPAVVCRETHVCPTFANGKMGILWFSPMTNQVVCLPRGCNGAGFGLIRKNKPRKKAIITAADGVIMRKAPAIAKKVQKAARSMGLKGCNLR